MLVNLMDQSVQRRGLDSGLCRNLAWLSWLTGMTSTCVDGHQDLLSDGHEVDAAAITESE